MPISEVDARRHGVATPEEGRSATADASAVADDWFDR